MNAYSLNGRLYEWLIAALTQGKVNALKREMMPRLAIEPGQRILDWGCGAGAAHRLAIPQLQGSGHVCGVDVSPSLIRRAAALAPASEDLQFTFVVREGFALQLKAPCDAALACHSLGVLEPGQVEAGVEEIWRNLRSGAHLLITDMYAPQQVSWLKSVVQKIKKLLANKLFGQQFCGHVLPAARRFFEQREIVRRDDLMAFAYIGVRRDVPLPKEMQDAVKPSTT